jgi:hypothetical protein
MCSTVPSSRPRARPPSDQPTSHSPNLSRQPDHIQTSYPILKDRRLIVLKKVCFDARDSKPVSLIKHQRAHTGITRPHLNAPYPISPRKLQNVSQHFTAKSTPPPVFRHRDIHQLKSFPVSAHNRDGYGLSLFLPNKHSPVLNTTSHTLLRRIRQRQQRPRRILCQNAGDGYLIRHPPTRTHPAHLRKIIFCPSLQLAASSPYESARLSPRRRPPGRLRPGPARFQPRAHARTTRPSPRISSRTLPRTESSRHRP